MLLQKNVTQIKNLELWDEEFEGIIIPKTVLIFDKLGADSYNPSPFYYENEEFYDRFYSDEYALCVNKYCEQKPPFK